MSSGQFYAMIFGGGALCAIAFSLGHEILLIPGVPLLILSLLLKERDRSDQDE